MQRLREVTMNAKQNTLLKMPNGLAANAVCNPRAASDKAATDSNSETVMSRTVLCFA